MALAAPAAVRSRAAPATARRRLRICYLVPGHGLLSTVGPSRNVLSLAKALRAHAEVTLAFRYCLERADPEGVEVVELEPERRPRTAVDDGAMSGMGLAEFARYMARLRRFVREAAGRFDVILEKSWLLSGHLSAYGLGLGVPGIPVENVVPSPARHREAGFAKRMRVEVGRRLAGPALRRVPVVLAETPQLKASIVAVWGVPAERVEVVPLGVDTELFRPLEQDRARASLGLLPDRYILLYVGVLDETHTLDGIIEAVIASRVPGLELHILGDGSRRERYAQQASRSGGTVILHGRVPHASVPTWIAAADLCLAPYEPRAFATGTLGYATMKVPEYLSVGRPVAGSPSERMRELLRGGELGFLLDADADSWRAFLADPPPRERLARMGAAALRYPHSSWDDTARGYLAACERALASLRS